MPAIPNRLLLLKRLWREPVWSSLTRMAEARAYDCKKRLGQAHQKNDASMQIPAGGKHSRGRRRIGRQEPIREVGRAAQQGCPRVLSSPFFTPSQPGGTFRTRTASGAPPQKGKRPTHFGCWDHAPVARPLPRRRPVADRAALTVGDATQKRHGR